MSEHRLSEIVIERPRHGMWNKVYSQLCRRLDNRTMVGQHVIDHLWDYVERYVELIEGIP